MTKKGQHPGATTEKKLKQKKKKKIQIKIQASI
jgi:hypothetical protein